MTEALLPESNGTEKGRTRINDDSGAAFFVKPTHSFLPLSIMQTGLYCVPAMVSISASPRG